MNSELKLSEILNYLKKNNFEYEFIGDAEGTVVGYSTLFNYKDSTMTFVSTLNQFKDYVELFYNKKIQLIILGPNEKYYDNFINVIKVAEPKNVFFSLLEYFYGESSEPDCFFEIDGEYNNYSFVSSKAEVGNNVKIGAGCVIEDNVFIGDNTVIHHNVTIRKNTKIGKNCTIFSGVVIGERGFSPLSDEAGNVKMLPHYGGVTIEDNVHIGDNSCIIRGSLDDTVIRTGSRLNTLVHVAHNSIIGRNTVITMPTHISGSVIIGDNCHIAATSIRNQCVIGDGATLGLGSVVVNDVSAGETVVGIPAKPLNKVKRKLNQ